MSDAKVTQAFLEDQIEALPPFGFLVFGSASQPLHVLETNRLEDGGLEVRVPGRPPGIPELGPKVQAALKERGFTLEEEGGRNGSWSQGVDAEADAVDLMQRVMHEVFEEPEDLAMNIAQGNRREEHDARQRLARVGERIEKVLPDLIGAPVERDADGDYVLPIGTFTSPWPLASHRVEESSYASSRSAMSG